MSFSSFIRDPLNLLGGKEAAAAAEKQLAAQEAAQRKQEAMIAQTRGQLNKMAVQGRQDLIGYNQQGLSALGNAYGQQQGYYGQAGQALGQGNQSALAELYGGYGGQAAQSVGGGQGLSSLLGRSDAMSQRIDQRVNIEEDPGYQFRLQQGEQAINRAAAAKGGRHGGATLKALADYNQGLASQEFGNAFGRQQSRNQAQMSNLGQLYAAAGNVDAMQQNANLAAQRNQMGLAQLASGYENQYGSNLANLYAEQAGAAQQYGAGQASIYSNTGANLGNLATNMAGNQVALTGQYNQANQNFAQYPGMVEQSQANTAQSAVSAAGSIVGAL